MTTINNKHCVVLGANGQVGRALVKALETTGAKVTALTRKDVDVSDLSSLEDHIKSKNAQTNINYLFNCIAYTAVDNAENEPDLADKLNHQVPSLLAELSQQLGFKLVHYSTDYVYPGDGEAPYSENSPTGPLSVYGKTKLAGDKAIINNAPTALIGRTSWVYDREGKNFVNTMLRLAESRTELNVVNDQIGAPTSADFIAETTLKLLAKEQQGVFHIVPAGHTSWAEFAREIFKIKHLDVTVHGIPSSEYPTPAKRPLNSRLSTEKLCSALNQPIPDWRQVLAKTLGS